MLKGIANRLTWWMVISAISMAAAGCVGAGKQIKIGGGEAAISGFVQPVKETYEEENGIALKILPTKPGNELIDLEKGRVDAIVSAGSVNDLLSGAAEKNVAIDPALLREVKVGKSQTVVFLNRGNRLAKLSKKQVKGIFSGRITNWKQVGGPNKEVVVIWNRANAIENEIFLKEILDGEPLASQIVAADGFDAVRKLVMETHGAVGIGPHSMIASAVKVPKIPKLAAPVVVVTKGAPSPNVLKLIELMKDVELIP